MDALTFTETIDESSSFGASDSLGVSQTVAVQLDLTLTPSDVLAFEQTIEVHSPVWRTVEHSLGLSDSLQAKYPYRLSVGDTLEFVDEIAGQRFLNGVVSDQLSFSDVVARSVQVDIADSLALTDEGLKRDTSESVIAFTESIEVGKGGDVDDSVVLIQTVGLELDLVRSLSDGLSITQAVTYLVTGRRFDRQYCPFVGEGSLVSETLTSPLNEITAPFQLVYPAAGAVTDSVTLRAPEFGNKDRLAFNRIVRETRGGTLVVFADPMWPKIQTLVLTFTALRGPEKEDLLDFINDYVGQEIGLIDWEKRYWRGVVNPDVQAIEDSWNSYTVNLEFDGELDPTWASQVIPVIPGTPRRRVSPSHGAVPDPLEPVPPVEPTSDVYTAESDDTIVAGQPVYIKSTGHAALSAATSGSLSAAVGFATTAANPTFTVDYVTEGKLTLTDWTAVIGAATLVPGSAYYLSATSGQITTTPPSGAGQYVVRLGRATSTLTLDIEIEPSVRL